MDALKKLSSKLLKKPKSKDKRLRHSKSMPLQYHCISSLLEEQQGVFEESSEEPHSKAVYKGEVPIRVANITYPDLPPRMEDIDSPSTLVTNRAPQVGGIWVHGSSGSVSEFDQLIGQFPLPPHYNAHSALSTKHNVGSPDRKRSSDLLPPNPAFDTYRENSPCNYVSQGGNHRMQPVSTANARSAYSTSHANASVPNLGYGRTGAGLGHSRSHIPITCLPYGVAAKSNVAVNTVGGGHSLSENHLGTHPTRIPCGAAPRPAIPVSGPSIDIRSLAVRPIPIKNSPAITMRDANGNSFTNVNDVYRIAVVGNKPHAQEQRPIVHRPSASHKHRSIHPEVEFSSLHVFAPEVGKHGVHESDVRRVVAGKQDGNPKDNLNRQRLTHSEKPYQDERSTPHHKQSHRHEKSTHRARTAPSEKPIQTERPLQSDDRTHNGNPVPKRPTNTAKLIQSQRPMHAEKLVAKEKPPQSEKYGEWPTHRERLPSTSTGPSKPDRSIPAGLEIKGPIVNAKKSPTHYIDGRRVPHPRPPPIEVCPGEGYF